MWVGTRRLLATRIEGPTPASGHGPPMFKERGNQLEQRDPKHGWHRLSLARRLSMTHVGIHKWVKLTLLSSGASSEFAGASPALPFTITTQAFTALAPSCLRISWLDVASAGLLCTHRYITLHVASPSPRDGAFEAQARLSRRRGHIFPSHDSSASCVMYVCVCVRRDRQPVSERCAAHSLCGAARSQRAGRGSSNHRRRKLLAQRELYLHSWERR